MYGYKEKGTVEFFDFQGEEFILKLEEGNGVVECILSKTGILLQFRLWGGLV